jgi:hypothetical protein
VWVVGLRFEAVKIHFEKKERRRATLSSFFFLLSFKTPMEHFFVQMTYNPPKHLQSPTSKPFFQKTLR